MVQGHKDQNLSKLLLNLGARQTVQGHKDQNLSKLLLNLLAVVPISPGHPSITDEAWHWLKHAYCTAGDPKVTASLAS